MSTDALLLLLVVGGFNAACLTIGYLANRKRKNRDLPTPKPSVPYEGRTLHRPVIRGMVWDGAKWIKDRRKP